jgi:hypothetical protein
VARRLLLCEVVIVELEHQTSDIWDPTMTDIEQIQSIRSQTLAQLDSIRADPKPTYWIDGQRVHWQEYADSLQRTVDWCDQKLVDYEPFEVRSHGVT